MKQRSLIAAAVASALFFGGCNNQGNNTGGQATSKAALTPAPVAPKPENVVATVNGKPISKESVKLMIADIEQRRGPSNIPEEKIVDALISQELLRQEAEKLNLTSDPQVAARLDNAMRVVLYQLAVENFMKNAAVSDEDIKKEYDTRIGAMKQTEYKARHILVDSEAAAKDTLAKLQKGAKFEDLAKKLSKDPGSKENGGDLGWFNPQQMVPPFANAVIALKNGETSTAPVQTQFGWHIIKREDSREQAPPPFDQVKDQIKSYLQNQKLQQHVADLKSSAKIERMSPPAPPSPQAAAPGKPAEAGQKAPDTSLESGKTEAPKEEAGKAEPSKPEAAKPQASKQEAGASEQHQQEEGEPETPAQEAE